LDTYVSTKIKSTLCFINILKEVERQEQEHFNTKTSAKENKISFEDEGYSIVKKIEYSIHRDIKHIITERLFSVGDAFENEVYQSFTKKN
jgi:hypothetical protein